MRILAGAIVVLAGSVALAGGAVAIGLGPNAEFPGGFTMFLGLICGIIGFAIVVVDALPRRGRMDDEPPLQGNPPS